MKDERRNRLHSNEFNTAMQLYGIAYPHIEGIKEAMEEQNPEVTFKCSWKQKIIALQDAYINLFGYMAKNGFLMPEEEQPKREKKEKNRRYLCC